MDASSWVMLFSHDLAEKWHGDCGVEESLASKYDRHANKAVYFLRDGSDKTNWVFVRIHDAPSDKLHRRDLSDESPNPVTDGTTRCY